MNTTDLAELRSAPAITGTPWIIALDVDGTIMTRDEQISPAVRSAIEDARDSGHGVVVTTGRSLVATLPVVRELGLTEGWAICSNGSVILRLDPTLPDGYEVTDLLTFAPGDVMRRLRTHLPEAIFAIEHLGHGFYLTETFPEGELQGAMTVVPFDELCDIPATRVTIRAPGRSADEFLELLDRIGLHGVSYAVGWVAWLDLNPEGVSKASGLETVRSRCEIPRERTMAVGDGRNDIEMLGWAARGVAMGGSVDDVIAVADEVTGSVEEDGVATVMRTVI